MVITVLTFTSHVLRHKEKSVAWETVFIIVLSKFPHYWVFSPIIWGSCKNAELRLLEYEKSTFVLLKV